jgi:glycosyltransferase involved in cell wall biosynthesis
MSRPQVSVVIPAWNAAEWIGETVLSAVSQTDADLEVIVVDDGSTDDSAAAATAAGGDRVRVLRQPNGGASRARNAGTEAARGEFIQYLDADDLLTPGTIARRVECLESARADVAYCDWATWERGGDAFVEREIVRRTIGPDPELDLVGDAWWPPAALLYRRTLVDRIGPWREDLPIIQDARFLQDAAFSGGTFAHVPGVGARYRVLAGTSLSRRDRRAFLDDCFRNAVMIEDMWTRKGGLNTARRQALARVFSHVAVATASTDPHRSEDAVARVMSLDPAFVPDAGSNLRPLSQLAGYRRAVRLSGWWHRRRSVVTAAS